MKLLFLAPQPFFEERGTPIAVKLALSVLAERYPQAGGHQIALVTYHLGRHIEIPGVAIDRMPCIWPISSIRPGISIAKLVCDLVLLIKVLGKVWAARHQQYTLIHAAEESAFIAVICKFLFGVPFVYDMDSSLSMQLVDRWWWLKPFKPIFNFLEGQLIRQSIAVIPVCDALGELAKLHGKTESIVLSDVSLLSDTEQNESLRTTLGLAANSILCLYSGNLEKYQGIDLLLHALSIATQSNSALVAVIIGGNLADCQRYALLIEKLALGKNAFLIGPRPIEQLNGFLSQADILVTPRITGNNTPMKIYSYLHSGKPMVATRLQTHTQVLNDQVAILTEATPEAFAQGLLALASDPALRQTIGAAAKALAEAKYTYPVFKRSLNRIYDSIERANGLS